MFDYSKQNFIYIQLRAQHKSVFYYSEAKECDFIFTQKGKKPLAIQVCHTLERDNLEWELGGLYKALSFFKIKEGVIITLNQSDSFNNNGLITLVIKAWELKVIVNTHPIQTNPALSCVETTEDKENAKYLK